MLAGAGTTGCSTGPDGGDGWTAPKPGQAAVLLDTSDSGPDAALGFDGGIDGIAIASDGSVYGLGASLVKVTEDRKAEAVLNEEAHGAAGLVPLPDGSLVFGRGNAVKQLGTDGRVSVLAGGATGGARKPGRSVPSSVTAEGFAFADQVPVPFGTRPDGSILIADTDVVWALKGNRLSRVHRLPAATTGERPTLLRGNAVDGKGTVYVAAGTPTGEEHLKDILMIGPDGSTAEIVLPGTVEGVQGDPGDLKPTWLAGDGKDGIYAHVYDAKGDYVLHIRSGSAKLVARYSGRKNTDECELPRPIDAVHMPCALPYALAYRSGRLILGGESRYLIDIATE